MLLYLERTASNFYFISAKHLDTLSRPSRMRRKRDLIKEKNEDFCGEIQGKYSSSLSRFTIGKYYQRNYREGR